MCNSKQEEIRIHPERSLLGRSGTSITLWSLQVGDTFKKPTKPLREARERPAGKTQGKTPRTRRGCLGRTGLHTLSLCRVSQEGFAAEVKSENHPWTPVFSYHRRENGGPLGCLPHNSEDSPKQPEADP